MKSTGRLLIVVFTFLALAASAYAADDSLLFEAVKKGDKAEVEALLARGADVNAKKSGLTPLHVAVQEWKKDIAEFLLFKGANVNADGTYGTPLHLAARYGVQPIADVLLAKGADVNAKNSDGDTPLRVAEKFTKYHEGRLGLAKENDNVYFVATLRQPYTNCKLTLKLLEEHMYKQASLNPRAALVQMTVQLKDSPDDGSTRRLIIKLASELKPAPVIPEEARKHFVEGTAIVKAAKNPAQQALAAQSFTEALKVAPWWGDAYYNLGVAQELAEEYDAAEQAFNFYLLSDPSATEKREVQDRIYALSAKRKLLGSK